MCLGYCAAARLLARLNLLQRPVIHHRQRTAYALGGWRLNMAAGAVICGAPLLRVGFDQRQSGAIEHRLTLGQQLLDWFAHDDGLGSLRWRGGRCRRSRQRGRNRRCFRYRCRGRCCRRDSVRFIRRSCHGRRSGGRGGWRRVHRICGSRRRRVDSVVRGWRRNIRVSTRAAGLYAFAVHAIVVTIFAPTATSATASTAATVAAVFVTAFTRRAVGANIFVRACLRRFAIGRRGELLH